MYPWFSQFRYWMRLELVDVPSASHFCDLHVFLFYQLVLYIFLFSITPSPTEYCGSFSVKSLYEQFFCDLHVIP